MPVLTYDYPEPSAINQKTLSIKEKNHEHITQ